MQSVLAATPVTGGGSIFNNPLVPMVIMFVIFYFLLIAPMRKKQKAHSEMIGNLKNGDKVITNGGIHATVVGQSDHTLQVRIADGVKIDISRNAISALQSEDA